MVEGSGDATSKQQDSEATFSMPIPPFPNKRKEEKLSKIALFLTSTSSEGKFNPSAENAQNWRANNPGSDLFKETTPHQVPQSCQGQINSFDHFLNLDEVGKVKLCRYKTAMNRTKLDSTTGHHTT